jgi:ornithine--oxo-acid transaminase
LNINLTHVYLLTCGRIVAPPKSYLKEVAALCKKHDVLLIVDEVQCGLGRAGANLCHLKEGVRPDLVVLGKALARGTSLHQSIFAFGDSRDPDMYPLSGVMGDDDVMDLHDSF